MTAIIFFLKPDNSDSLAQDFLFVNYPITKRVFSQRLVELFFYFNLTQI